MSRTSGVYYMRPPAPVCPVHGIPMVVRKSRDTYREFECRVGNCARREFQERHKQRERRVVAG